MALKLHVTESDVMAKRCPSCGALPNVDCDAPRKQRGKRRIARQHKSRFHAAKGC